MIGRVLGPHIVNEDSDNEMQSYLVAVQDDETGEIRDCVQNYDGHNSLIDCTGYIVCPVSRDGSTVIGHRLLRMTKAQSEYVDTIKEVLDPQPVVKAGK